MEEFWGVEVKNGESLKVSPGDGLLLHISQASLGELKDEKRKENVNLFVNVDGKKLVLGTLITNKLPQHQFDLLFDRDFELSHNWKSGSVYYYGYKTSKTFEDKLLVGESDGKKTTPLLGNEANKQTPKKYRCNICERLFGSELVLETHTKVMHDGSKNTPLIGNEATEAPPTNHPNKQTPKTSRCNFCNRLFGSEQALEAHTKVVHVGNNTAPLIGNEATKAPTNQPNKQTRKKSRCNICYRSFGSEQGLEAHTKDVHACKSKSKEDIPLNPETNGKTEPKANEDKPIDAERVIAFNGKESDARREPVKIAETHKDLNTIEDEESTFEDVMTDDDDVADPQVVTSKKRLFESVESATVTPIPEKKAKVTPERTDGNETALLLGNEATEAHPTNQPNENTPRNYPCRNCNRSFTSEEGMKKHTKAKHGAIKQA